MAGSPRAGNSSFWTTIVDLALAAQATAQDLYTNGINRLADRTIWLRDAITSVRSDLAQTAAGTKATVIGTIDISGAGVVYDPVTGTLNGSTLQTQADTGGVITTTFVAPTGPADVVAAIAAAAGSHQSIGVDAAGHLNVASSTTGSGSTITIVGGSAVVPLGFSNGQNATGVSSGNDGISRVSGAQVVGARGTLPAGTLRSMLQYLVDHGTESGTLTRAEDGLIFDFGNTPPFPGIAGTMTAGATGHSVQQTIAKPPHGSSLTSVSWYAKPDAHGSLPQNMPNFRVYKVNLLTGVSTLITAIITDPSANTTAYDASHAIVAPITVGNGPGGTSEIIDRTTYMYYGSYFGESGTNSDANTVHTGCVSTFTV